MTKDLTDKELHLKIPTGPKATGHDIDFGTFTNKNGFFKPWITKLNKHEGQKGVDASVLEVIFSELAVLFIKPSLTPAARIVRRGDKVVGVASEHFKVQIKELQEQGKNCYNYDPQTHSYKPINSIEVQDIDIALELSELLVRDPNLEITEALKQDIVNLKKSKHGVHFLDKMPQGFFSDLMEQFKAGELDIDMESLATILTASYALEEDDLHKGNIGFYIYDVPDPSTGAVKKCFTFFKIDHDLMFSASIMSRQDMRIANILYSEDDFKITQRDLEDFPDLQDSGNHYWPTKKQIMVKGEKAYKDPKEREAFADLKNNKAFNNAKWDCFLKFSLISPKLIEQAILLHLNPNEDSDKIGLVKQATSARINKLKQVLLECPGFIDYLKSENARSSKQLIIEEIKNYLEHSGMDESMQLMLLNQVDETFESFTAFAGQEKVAPLSKQIALGCYDGTLSKKPVKEDIEFAHMQFTKCQQKGDLINAFKYRYIVLDLIKNCNGLDSIDKQTFLKEMDRFRTSYLNLSKIQTFEDFQAIADKIRLSDIPLKEQKRELFQIFKLNRMPLAELVLLKNALEQKDSCPSLKFLHQMRSDLWLVRKFAGLYGKTSTTTAILDKINSKKPVKEDIEFAYMQFAKYQQQGDLVKAFQYSCIILDFTKKCNSLDSIDKQGLLKEMNQFKESYLNLNELHTFKDFKVIADKIRLSSMPLAEQQNELLEIIKLKPLPLAQLWLLKHAFEHNMESCPSLKVLAYTNSDGKLIEDQSNNFASCMVKEINTQITKQSKDATILYKTKIHEKAVEQQEKTPDIFKKN